MDIKTRLLSKMYAAVGLFISEMKTPRDYGVGFPVFPAEAYLMSAIKANSQANVGELADRLEVTKGAVSQISRKLTRKGLIETYQLEDNRKEVYLRLTNLGKKVLVGQEKFRKKLHGEIFNYLGRLEEKNIQVILDFFDTMIKSVPDNYQKAKDSVLHVRRL